jgi:Cof subfamily protein (haloacid dehalogenase superfamily)
MTPSVVATDLDGTVVRSDGTVSARTRSALDSARAAGALVIIATGRPPRWLDGIPEATGHQGLAICANGGMVYDLAAQQVVAAHPLPAENARTIMAVLRAVVPGIAFALERVDGLFAHEAAYVPRWEPEANTVVGDLDEVMTGPISKLLGRREGLDSDELLAVVSESIETEAASFTHSSLDGLLEISAYGVTKASTLAEVLTERGLGAADVVAFGDMPNDLEMLAWAGRGVAMGNAHPDLKAVADEVTATNDDDGVALVLERLFRTP